MGAALSCTLPQPCNDPWAPLLQSLPDQVTLADARHLDAVKDTFISFGDLGNADTLLQSMKLSFGQPALACGQPSRPNRASPCLAALRIAADLVAVWYVQDGPDETAAQQAGREGRALAALVAFGLGAAEDFPALTAAACATLRPGAGPSSGRTAHDRPCKR
jgi:hypothetical protein